MIITIGKGVFHPGGSLRGPNADAKLGGLLARLAEVVPSSVPTGHPRAPAGRFSVEVCQAGSAHLRRKPDRRRRPWLGVGHAGDLSGATWRVAARVVREVAGPPGRVCGLVCTLGRRTAPNRIGRSRFLEGKWIRTSRGRRPS